MSPARAQGLVSDRTIGGSNRAGSVARLGMTSKAGIVVEVQKSAAALAPGAKTKTTAGSMPRRPLVSRGNDCVTKVGMDLQGSFPKTQLVDSIQSKKWHQMPACTAPLSLLSKSRVQPWYIARVLSLVTHCQVLEVLRVLKIRIAIQCAYAWARRMHVRIHTSKYLCRALDDATAT